MLFDTKLAILSLVAVAAAQSSTTRDSSATSSGAAPNPSGLLTKCITDCVGPAATDAGCGSFTNLTCVCTSTKFQTAAQNCLKANCTTTDMDNALNLQQQECKSVTNGTASATAKASGSSTASGAAATHSNGADAMVGNMWGLAAGIVGAAVAAAL